MENMNNKISRIPIKTYTDAPLEKYSNTPVSTPSTHGVKVSMNMSSEAKRDFLNKFEEWRKKKREKFIEKICEEKKENENHQTKAETFLTRNKQIKTFSSTGKKVMPNFSDKESVFERLYRNSRGVKNRGKESVGINKETLSRSIENTVPELKKKNDILKPEEIQKNEDFIDRGLIVSANNSEMQSNFVAQDEDDIVGTEYNIDDNIVAIANNMPRATFVVATKETPITESLNSQTVFNIEETTLKSNEMRMENFLSNSMEETTNKVSSENDLLYIKEEVKDSHNSEVEEKEIFEENLETLNKTFDTGAKSIEDTDRVSQQSKKSAAFNKTFSAKPKEKKNYKFPDFKKKNNELDAKKTQTSLRKSISSIYFQKCGIPQKSTIKNIASERNQHVFKPTSEKKEIDKVFQPIKENKNLSGIKGIPSNTTLHKKNLTSSCLRTKLEDWLTLNNHSLEGYRHLRCFGFTDTANIVGQTPIKSNKKDFSPKSIESEVSNLEDDCNKENLSPSAPAEQMTPCEDENRLKELYQLIVDLKYDPDRCEDWLIAIRKRNPRVTDLPIYWECLTALNRDNENIKSSVEQYEKALANKEEKNVTDSALAQLFDKLLIDQQKPNEHKLEKGIDPKNIFRSTIIKFSLQQKVTKESTTKEGEENNSVCKYVATPVRRSSRLWTPHKNYVVNSLQALSPQIRENVTFKTNDSILN